MEISLLIPAYNVANFLPKLMEDVRKQDPPFSEIIVYDDASVDNTAEIAKSLGVDRVIIGEKNRGAAFARNRLIENSNCPWIHFHDADDRLDVSYTATMLKNAPESDEVIICGAKSWIAATDQYLFNHETPQLDRCDDLNIVLYSQCQIGRLLQPTDLVKKMGGFNESLRGWEDYDYVVRLFLAGAQFRVIPEILTTYCRYGGRSFVETQTSRYHRDGYRLLSSYIEKISPTFHPTLGKLLVENAYQLFLIDEFELANDAIVKAKKIGRAEIVSSFAIVKLLSSIVGIRTIFHFRRIRDLLSKKSYL